MIKLHTGSTADEGGGLGDATSQGRYLPQRSPEMDATSSSSLAAEPSLENDFPVLSSALPVPTVHADLLYNSSAPAPSRTDSLPVSPALKELVPHVLTFTQRPYDFLERKIERQRRRLAKESLGIVFHSSSPLSILLRRPVVACFFLLVASVHLFFTADDLVRKHIAVTSTVFRFTPQQLRSGQTDITAPHVSEFLIMQVAPSGCLEPVEADWVYVQGEHMFAYFEEETRMDGFAIVTGGAVMLDPVRFVVSVQRGEGEWEAVGYSRWWVPFSGQRRQRRAARDMPEARGERVTVDVRASADWPWHVGRVGGDGGLVLGWAVAGAAGLCGSMHQRGHGGLFAGWLAGVVMMAAAAVCSVEREDSGEAAMWGVYAAVLGVGREALRVYERRLLGILPAVAVTLLTADVVCHGWLVGEGMGDATITRSHVVLAGCMLAAGGALWVISLAQDRVVVKQVGQDRERYREMWERVRASAGAGEQLARLERALEAARRRQDVAQPNVVRQCLPGAGQGSGARDEDEEAGVLGQWWAWVRQTWSSTVFDMHGLSTRGRPVRSLDQVYAQAISVDPLFRAKVQAWALGCGGMFPGADGGLLRWREVAGEAGGARRVKWGQIKAEGRAMEKVIRCYGEEASRLVDVCRQSIVFATLRELAECFEAVVSDAAVEVVRVKNRMRVEEDGAWSAGFRNVSLNLRVLTAEAQSLGVDSHICELQLLLSDFAMLQGAEGRHRRYLRFRDCARPRLVVRQPAGVGWVLDKVAVLAGMEGEIAAAESRSRSSLGLKSLRSLWTSASSRSRASSWWTRQSSNLSNSSDAATEPSFLSSSIYDFSHSGGSRGSGREQDGGFKMFNFFSLSRLAAARQASAESLSPLSAPRELSDAALLALRALLYRRNTSAKGKKGHLRDFWQAMESVSASSVLFIKRPLHGAFAKRGWRALAVLLSLFCFILPLSIVYNFFRVGGSFTFFRFTALGTRAAPYEPPAHHGLAAFGVAVGVCATQTQVAAVEEAGASISVRYSRPVWMDAFWMRTANHSADLDPARFWVEGSDDGQSWEAVAANGYAHFTISDVGPIASQPSPPLEERGATTFRRIAFNSMMGLAHVVIYQTLLPFAAAVGTAAVRAAHGKLDNVQLLALGFVASFVVYLAGAIFLAVSGDWQHGLLHGLVAPVFAVNGCAIAFWQHRLFAVACGTLLYGLVVRLVGYTLLLGGSLALLSDVVTIMLLLVLVVLALAGAIRMHILFASRRVVSADKQLYDALWQRIRAEQRELLEELKALTEAPLRNPMENPRQYYHSNVTSGFSSVHGRQRLVPITDIDQIYAQALCLHPILLAKVQAWALGCGGMFPGADGGLLRWREVAGEAGGARRVKWGQIKAEGRAMEKVIRCYGEEASRLVDVCRQSIVFATLRELAECFEAVVSDAAVEVVRVKNRMRVEEDGAWSAGFRNVSLNLRVLTAEAQSLGVDSHICELQLLLSDFAMLQKAGHGHKRYVHFRNVRGE